MRLDPRAVLPYLVGDHQREKLLALCRRPSLHDRRFHDARKLS
jgi:hypothetical protein